MPLRFCDSLTGAAGLRLCVHSQPQGPRPAAKARSFGTVKPAKAPAAPRAANLARFKGSVPSPALAELEGAPPALPVADVSTDMEEKTPASRALTEAVRP